MYLRDTLRVPAEGLSPSAHPDINLLIRERNAGTVGSPKYGCRASPAMKAL